MQMQLHASGVDTVHMNERLGKKKERRKKSKQRRIPTEALRWFVFYVSVFHFIILQNGRIRVFYTDLCFVKSYLEAKVSPLGGCP